ncbi:MAG: hypothetical protein LLG04_17620, partial [Parachlamydia sp.]|nr:hypothetical protein [Parachlamydia sp.]
QIDFDLVLSKSPTQIKATLTLTRVRFHVKNSAGTSATFDSDHAEKTFPEPLHNKIQIFKDPLIFQIGVNGEVSGNFPIDFFTHLEGQFEGNSNSLKEILPAVKKFWFLREANFKNILLAILSNRGTDIKAGENYEITIQPRLSPELFQLDASNLATSWLANNNFYTQEYLLLINGISSTEVQGLWKGDAEFNLQDPTGTVVEKLKCKGNVTWNRKNALQQNRTWTCAGEMESKLKKAPAKINFSFEETIQTQPSVFRKP